MTGILYLIPNTLGAMTAGEIDSMDLIIPRHVQQITSQLTAFVAENAKTTRAFLKLISLNNPLQVSLPEIRITELNVNTPDTALEELLIPLKKGQDVGLISEAGVPAVADPGANLVRLAHRHLIRVKPLVGPSSLLLAIMSSGLNGQSFAFNGYLPVNPAERVKKIKELELRSRREQQTQLFIETPYRNAAMFESLVEHCQTSTSICVATDLTLESETIQTQTAGEWKVNLKSGNPPDVHRKPTVFLLLSN
jgi:16S rRNA (cytidine1402-2'-O)-methyltransferase